MSGLYSLLLSKFPDDIQIAFVPNPLILDNEPKIVVVDGTDLGFTILDGEIRNLVDFRYSRKPAIEINSEGFSYAHINGALFTFVIIDGQPVHIRDYPILEFVNVNQIKSVEILKNPKNPGKYLDYIFNEPQNVASDFALLNIYTNSGKGLYGITNTKGFFKNTLPSFSISKEFYTPKHENLTKSDWENPDLRSTVFWNPNIKIDKNGNTKVEFYTDDNLGEMMVIIESISEEGQLGYYQTSYTVNKKINPK